MNIRQLAAAAALVIGASSSAEAGLISNGGFDTGSFSGWAHSFDATPGDNFVNCNSPNVSPSCAAWLGNSSGLGTLSQSFATAIGASYNVEFFLTAFNGSRGADDNEFHVDFGGTRIFDQTNVPAPATNVPSGPLFVFTQHDIPVTATSLATTLTFYERDLPGFLFLDSVDVTLVASAPLTTAIAEPASLGLLAGGFIGWSLLGRRRRASS